MARDQANRGVLRGIRSVLPQTLLREREIVLRLGPGAGAVYARLKLLDCLGVRSQNSGFLRASSRSMLFVCFGNIMRSPMAAALLRKATREAHLPDVDASSAGLHAISGNKAHPWAVTASAEMGLPLNEHRARRLTPDMVSRADVIFAMDLQNKAELFASYPESRQKVLLLSAFAHGKSRDREIADPYFGNLDTTRGCYAILQTCVGNLTSALVALRTTEVRAKASSEAPTRKGEQEAEIAHK